MRRHDTLGSSLISCATLLTASCGWLNEPATVVVRIQNHYGGCSPMIEGWLAKVSCAKSGYSKKITFKEPDKCEHEEEFEDVPPETCTFSSGAHSVQAKVSQGGFCQITMERIGVYKGGLVDAVEWVDSGLSCD